MILVTGASGHVGGRIAELLAEQQLPIRMMTRHPDRLPVLKDVEVAHGDYADPETLDNAFIGIDRAFIVSGYNRPGERARLHINAIDAAVRAGVKHIVYLSFQGASPTSRFPMARDHYQTEEHLRACGVPFTALRDNLYIDALPEMFNPEGVVRGPADDGRVAWVAREDVARVAAAILASPADYQGVYDVTGPEAITMTESAERLSRIAGRTLRFENESVEEGKQWRREITPKEWMVDVWIGSYEATAAGELADTSDTVLKITGRRPYNLEEYFAEHPELLERFQKLPV